MTPTTSGMPNNNCKAIAEPMTSARSHAAMAISAKIQRMMVMGRLYSFAAGLSQIALGSYA